MRKILSFALVFTALLLTCCTMSMQYRIGPESEYDHKDYRIHVGGEIPKGPVLLKINSNGSCDFKLYRDGKKEIDSNAIFTSATPQQMIDGRVTKFFGYLLECDATSKTALVRVFYERE